MSCPRPRRRARTATAPATRSRGGPRRPAGRGETPPRPRCPRRRPTTSSSRSPTAATPRPCCPPARSPRPARGTPTACAPACTAGSATPPRRRRGRASPRTRERPAGPDRSGRDRGRPAPGPRRAWPRHRASPASEPTPAAAALPGCASRCAARGTTPVGVETRRPTDTGRCNTSAADPPRPTAAAPSTPGSRHARPQRPSSVGVSLATTPDPSAQPARPSTDENPARAGRTQRGDGAPAAEQLASLAT